MVLCGLLEGMGDLENFKVFVSATDNLQADRKAFIAKPTRNRDGR